MCDILKRQIIFIIGTHRSGSTLLKNILDKNSNITMLSDEPDIADPWHHTFLDSLKKIGDLEAEDKLDKLINLLKSGNIYGTFWKEFATSGIDFNVIRERIKKSDKSPKQIFSIILDEYKKLSGKPIVGAKYPLHPSKVSILLDWFPDAKFIFLIRNIYASAVSRINDEATTRRKKKVGPFAFVVHYFTLIWFIVDFNMAARAYKKYQNKFLLVKYENLVLDYQNTLEAICHYIETKYEPEMSNAFGKPSSYTGEIRRGVDVNRINNWKKKIKKIDFFLIKILTIKSRNVFGFKA